MATPRLATAKYLERIRDGLIGEYTDMPLGSGTTLPTESDTALESEVINKAVTESFPESTCIAHTAQLTVAEGDGTSFTEAGVETAGDELGPRIVHAAVEKDNTFALRVTVKTCIQNEGT